MTGAPRAYAVNLVLAGRACLVVGGGTIAARKAEALVDCGAVVTVVAPHVGPEIEALVSVGSVTVERRPYAPGDAARYRLVVSATDDPAVDRTVFEEAEAAGVWVNTADDPDLCSFTMPAVLRRGDLTVAVSTGGRSPALAAWLRTRLDDEIGDEYEVLLDLVADARDGIRASGRSTEGLDWQRALDSNMLELIRAGQIGKARERLQACLSSS